MSWPVSLRWTRRRELHQVCHKANPGGGRLSAGKSPTDELRALPGSGRCADCGRAAPDWSAKNHGVIVCIRCAGAHRKLGTHVSTVLSLVADDWDEASLELVRGKGGNDAVNALLEAKLPAGFSRAGLAADDAALERFIRSKYEAGAFRAEGAGQLVLAPHRATSSSRVAMVEYVGLVFLELLSGSDLPPSHACFAGQPYVVFSTSGQSSRTAAGQADAHGGHSWPAGKVSLNCKSTAPLVAVQLYAKDALGTPRMLAVGGMQLSRGMPERTRVTVRLAATHGTPEQQQQHAAQPGGPSLDVLVSLHIIT